MKVARSGVGASSRRLVALLAVMVVVPVGALTWLGARVVGQQEVLASHQVKALLIDRLREVDASIAQLMDARERALLKLAAAVPTGTDAIRAFLAGDGGGAEVLVVDLEGRVLYPPLGAPMSAREQALLDRTRTVWDGDALQAAVAVNRAGERPGVDHAWYGYFYGGGLNLLLWRAEGDRVVAVELSRIAVMSDVIAHLPATTVDGEAPGRPESRVVLADESGEPIYQWGPYEPPAGEAPRAALALSPPLAAWSLRDYSPESALPTGLTGGLTFNLGAALLAVALALVALAIYLYRVRTREMQLAAQRVSFVNQVSHELKTPLTNIRLYAELLAEELDVDPEDPDADAGDPAARHLKVITGESQRLSRLIANVLTFARGQEGRLAVRPRPRVLDDVVRAVRATFAPSLDQAGVTVVLDLDAADRVLVDADAVEQILANLLSNVEKYARTGGEVRVTTRRDGDVSTVTVADQGPGIPAASREDVFLPFRRLSDKLSDGAAGTGIGLDIARQLARLHGGDLRLVDAARGACFALTLHTPPARGEDGP
ncbi:MAG: HAMP domain-containing histidine kinase [Deltaproteobacteria bacterium]|nr:MAG: HAMP domain-containing histidine kinase [Deltaproteobacteria bacterium]